MNGEGSKGALARIVVAGIRLVIVGPHVVAALVVAGHHHASVGLQHGRSRPARVLLIVNESAPYCLHAALRTIL
jgi:hypothetical protein